MCGLPRKRAPRQNLWAKWSYPGVRGSTGSSSLIRFSARICPKQRGTEKRNPYLSFHCRKRHRFQECKCSFWRRLRHHTPRDRPTNSADEPKKGSTSTERRFITLLDADPDQLPHRLRQMVALLKDYNLDLEALLKGLLYWNNDQKRTQNQWARDFYRRPNHEHETETSVAKEGNE